MLCKCGKPMDVKGKKKVCSCCGRREDIPYRVLSHEDALKEIKKLTDENIKLRLLLTQHVFDSQELEDALQD